ncbi:hypothetical protein [Chitinimonas sp. JJ19]|uniref:hypothetical protein n=1 Tax=Chitinimonas sp. JJ19 TaxID=3109352 RepID=UPI001A475F07|nr:hypothetical protein [Chitinimonas sp.]
MDAAQSTQATLGRLSLYAAALEECERILALDQLTVQERDSERARAKDSDWSKAQQQDRLAKDGGSARPLLLSDIRDFQRRCSKEFPSSLHCSQLSEYLRMLAVILFCQVSGPGNSDPGNVASNDNAFRKEYLERITSSVFTTRDDKKQYDEFVTACKNARDKMLGHADGKAFNIKHGDVVTTMNLHIVALNDLDFEYMRRVVSAIHRATMEACSTL